MKRRGMRKRKVQEEKGKDREKSIWIEEEGEK